MVTTTSFRANVVVAKTRYQMLKVFIILRSGERVTSFTKVNNANLSIKKWENEAFRKVYRYFEKTRKNFKSNLVCTRSRSRPRG